MLKKTKAKHDKAYKLDQLEILVSPLMRMTHAHDQHCINTRLTLIVNLNAEKPVFFKSFSVSLRELFKLALRKQWLNIHSKWMQMLDIDLNDL